MSCETCTPVPVRGRSSLPAVHSAYVTENTVSVSGSSLATENLSGGCYHSSIPDCTDSVIQACAPPLSRRRFTQKFLPGWVQNLTTSTKGRLLIAVGNYLHTFFPDNRGPLYFDGSDVTVEHPQLLSHGAGDEQVVEDGYIPLAFLDKEFRNTPAGPVEVEVMRHGTQQLRETGFGEMLGLTRDCAKGTVRQDVIQPEEHDLVKKGWIPGLKRLAYQEQTQSNGCFNVKVKKWFTTLGAVWSKEEIPVDKSDGGLEPSLVPVNTTDGSTAYVLSRREIEERDVLTQSEVSDYRVEVVKVTKDLAGNITGIRKQLVPVPAAYYEAESP